MIGSIMNNKLFKLLRTFEVDEWKKFRAFLISDVGERTEVVQVYDYIFRYRKNLEHKKLELNYAREQLFTGKTHKNFLNLVSKLHGYVLDYFAITNMRSDPMECKWHTTQNLSKRGLYEYVNNLNEKNETIFNELPVDIWHSFHAFRLEHLVKFSDNPIKTEQAENLYRSAHEHLNHHITEMSLFYWMDAISLSKTSRIYFDNIIDQFEKKIKQADLTTPLSRLLFRFIKFHKNKEPNDYAQLKEQILDSKMRWSHTIGATILINLINYQIRQNEAGTGSLSDLMMFYQRGLETGWLLDNGNITDTRFRTMVHVACFHEDKELAQELLEQWNHALHETNKQEVIDLCQAIIHFYRERFDESISLLSQTSFKQISHRNSARIFLMMNYYLIYDDRDFLINQLINLKSYFRRHAHHSSVHFMKGVWNFVAFMDRMIIKEDPAILRNELDHINPIVRRAWLRRYLDKKVGQENS